VFDAKQHPLFSLWLSFRAALVLHCYAEPGTIQVWKIIAAGEINETECDKKLILTAADIFTLKRRRTS